jgi:hypothetical protein
MPNGNKVHDYTYCNLLCKYLQGIVSQDSVFTGFSHVNTLSCEANPERGEFLKIRYEKDKICRPDPEII